MKTQELLDLLTTHSEKALLFEYAPKLWVAANYHITEVKHISIDSVDCGAGTDAWNETIIQLWESPSEVEKTNFMSAYKALGILKKVGRMRPYDLSAEVKFEYGNNSFHTAQLQIRGYSIQKDEIHLHLSVERTDCKAKEVCGVPEQTVTVSQEACCTPESGCC
ncbi:DUF6428 family protein [Altibacter sp.]|uniref:DUF6428 family protein n=1 Tax=Altibacter sp. TaxID=2024823 RepID=UPI000C8956E6|nr:DUF6428 family protein [Altibacter sp.]MAP55826.1 hypothetical protein [Altibacter sp.]